MRKHSEFSGLIFSLAATILMVADSDKANKIAELWGFQFHEILPVLRRLVPPVTTK